MQKINPVTQGCSTLAEKCRNALENSFGTNIPKPKTLSSETKQQDQKETEVDIETKENNLSAEDRPTEVSPCLEETDKDMANALEKINGQKRLSKDEFQRVYDIIWRKGPVTRYQHPDKWLASAEVQKTFWKQEG
jgi:hypothetical protein